MEPKIEVHVTINAHNPQKMKQKAGNMRLRWVGRRRGAFGHGKCTSNTNSNPMRKTTATATMQQ